MRLNITYQIIPTSLEYFCLSSHFPFETGSGISDETICLVHCSIPSAGQGVATGPNLLNIQCHTVLSRVKFAQD